MVKRGMLLHLNAYVPDNGFHEGAHISMHGDFHEGTLTPKAICNEDTKTHYTWEIDATRRYLIWRPTPERAEKKVVPRRPGPFSRLVEMVNGFF